MSTSFPAVSEGTSICQCDALSTGTNSITQCPAPLSLSATLPAPALAARAPGSYTQAADTGTYTHGHMVSCKHKHVGYTCTVWDAVTKLSQMYELMYNKVR